MNTAGVQCSSGTGATGPSTPAASAAAITDTGTAGTGITICTGAQGLTGWLSCIYNQLTGSIPAGSNVIGSVNQGTTPWVVDTNLTGNLYTAVTGPVPAGSNVIGGVTVAGQSDPCLGNAKVDVPIATSSGNLQLVAGVAAKKVYICSIHLVPAASAVVNIIEGTGGACTTANEAAVIGSTTASSGEALASNALLQYGNGGATVGVTATAANGICLLQSGTTALAGNITYIQQ